METRGSVNGYGQPNSPGRKASQRRERRDGRQERTGTEAHRGRQVDKDWKRARKDVASQHEELREDCVCEEDKNYYRWKKSREKHPQLWKQKQRAMPYRSTPPPVSGFELSFSVLFCSPQITVKSVNSVSCLLPVLSPSKGGF